jgi:phosphohistidine phosphatase SixA
MPSNLSAAMRPEAGLPRRRIVGAALAWPAVQAWAAADGDAAALLREGGVVFALRHALAPGTFDPPQFKLGDCSTQRNLSDEGRAQARRIGEWFKARSLQPTRVRSSPWCRCVDTATLAFGTADTWAALGSPRGASETTNAESLGQLRRAVAQARVQRGRFEVWVTHMFVLSDLVGTGSASGEGLVLKADAAGDIQVLARLPAA